MDLRFKYYVMISSVYRCIQLDFWCFPTYIFSNISRIFSWAGVCILDGIGIHLGREIGSNTVGICLGMLISVSSDLGLGSYQGASLPPILVAGLQRASTLLTPAFWLCFELNLELTWQAWVVS